MLRIGDVVRSGGWLLGGVKGLSVCRQDIGKVGNVDREGRGM